MVKGKMLWNQILLVWSEHYVSSRTFCKELGLDRQYLREKVQEQGWTQLKTQTIDQLEKACEALKSINSPDYDRLHVFTEHRKRQKFLLFLMLEMMLKAARE